MEAARRRQEIIVNREAQNDHNVGSVQVKNFAQNVSDLFQTWRQNFIVSNRVEEIRIAETKKNKSDPQADQPLMVRDLTFKMLMR